MKLLEQPYKLISVWENEWRFAESEEMEAVTKEFDSLLGRCNGFDSSWPPQLATSLRKFLKRHPNHIDALHHYASCLLQRGKCLDALTYSQTAVTTGMRVFPTEFVIGKDRLDTGYIQNRPFLRAVDGLVLAQRAMNLTTEAISTAELGLSLDPGDRMGIRERLALYFLESNRDRSALSLFERPHLKNSFSGTEYLHALTLIRVDRQEEARKCLRSCLHYYPQVARFILDSSLSRPADGDSPFGVAMGSPFEGWMYADMFGELWRSNSKAMALLREEATPHANRGWKRPPSSIAPEE